MIKEFKEFAFKGNLVDMAVGIIIGAAFTTVVKSLVDDVVMPLIGKVIGDIDFNNIFYALDGKDYSGQTLDKVKEQTAVLAYGSFLQNLFTFLIVALVVFLLVNKFMAAFNKQEEEEEAGPSQEELLTEIRDLLKK